MTAAEIRRALREGIVDPFDLVCREGSQLRVEILEVDEIFTAREDEGAGDGFTQVSPMPMAAAANAMPPTSYVHHIHHQHFSPAPMPQPQSHPRSNHPRSHQPRAYEPLARRKSQKKFYLIDRNGRMLGPLAAGEIQSLATRGIVGRGVFVQKIGEMRRVSLGSFLSNYARLNARVNRGVDLRSSAALNAVYRGMAARRFRSGGSLFPYLLVTMVGAILGFLVYFALHPQKDSDGRRVKHRQERRISQRSPAPKLNRVQQKKEKAKAIRSSKPVAVAPPVKQPAAAVKRPAPVSTQKFKKNIEVAPRERAKKAVQKTAKAKRVAPQATPKQRAPQPVAKRPTPVMPAPVKRTPAPVVVAKPSPPPAPPPKPKEPPKPVAPPPPPPAPKPQELVDGQLATLSGMSYSIAELDECPIKCKMRFSKPGGPTVTAVFFKGAHLDALLAKNGKATISGHVKKQGAETQIFLESVR